MAAGLTPAVHFQLDHNIIGRDLTIDQHGQAVGVQLNAAGDIYMGAAAMPRPVDPNMLAAAERQLAAMPHLTSHTLIGHQGERDHLCALHERLMAEQHGHTVVLTSPPGYGRHALAQALITHARAQGSAVVTADFRRETALPQEGFAGYTAAIAQRCPRTCQFAGRAWLAIMGALASLLESLGTVPRLTDLTLDDDPARGLATLLRHVARGHVRARRRPLVLVWEYVDQAPPLWHEMLRYLAPEIRRDLPVLLVVTATAACPLADLPAARWTAVLEVARTLTARQEAEVLWLDRLTESEVARYLGPADPRLYRRLHHLADGIPALVESLWQQWQDAIPPAVVRRHEQWEIARDDDVWVFGEARDQAYAILDACLSPDAPFTRTQVEEMLTVAALEGLTFTAQVVARAMALDPDDLMDFWDSFLLTREDRHGLLEEAGFLEFPAVEGEIHALNRYQFAVPYLWYVWVRDCAEPQRITCQRRVAEALERVYDGATDLVSSLLVALFEATGQEDRATPYCHRTQALASVDALRWHVALLETLERDGQAEASDCYRLFALRLDLSGRLRQETRWEEGYTQAERACTMACTWNDSVREAYGLNLMGLYLYDAAKFPEAQDLFMQALAIQERALGPDHLDVGISLNNLVLLYDAQGQYAAAEPLVQRAMAIRERALGPDHPAVAATLHCQADLYRAQKCYAEAGLLYQRALAIQERAFGPNHPDVAATLHCLANLYRAQECYAEAGLLYQRALAIRERVLGLTHPNIAKSLHNIAWLYYSQGHYTEAEPLLQRALAIREQGLRSDHPDVATSLNGLAACYHAQGRYAEAEPLYQRALALTEQVLSPDHPDVAMVRENYARLLQDIQCGDRRQDRSSEPYPQ